MKILLSAYACEPNKGSEPGIGWNWALHLAKAGHDVVVLTRSNNAPSIEQYLSDNQNFGVRLRLLCYDLPGPFLKLKKAGMLSIQLYYILWQIGAAGVAKRSVSQERFDVVWHVTYMSLSLPSLLWILKVPFIVGPSGGGERAPLAMRADFSLASHAKEFFRDLLIWITRINPLCKALFNRAKVIFIATPESDQLVPRRLRFKARRQMSIGIDEAAFLPRVTRSAGSKILFVGRFVYWKGLGIAIRSFAEFIRRGGAGRLTLVGAGPMAAAGKSLARALQVDHLLEWIPWIDQRDLKKLYMDNDIFLFPSLHDSSGSVVIEAMARGLPIVCLDLGGPAEIVSKGGGIIVSSTGLKLKEVERDLAENLRRLCEDQKEYGRLSEEAIACARDYLWPSQVEKCLSAVQEALDFSPRNI